jgi:hypothetical protein
MGVWGGCPLVEEGGLRATPRGDADYLWGWLILGVCKNRTSPQLVSSYKFVGTSWILAYPCGAGCGLGV